MLSRRSRGRFDILIAGLIACAACERVKQIPPAQSAQVQVPAGAVSTHAPRVRTWDASAGAVLLVAGESPAEALIVPPDSGEEASTIAAVPRPASVTLFGRDGSVQSAELQGSAANDPCRPWPLNAAPPPRPWNVGFIGGVVAPLPVDSLESLGRADSTTLVATAIRLASALPNVSAGRFSGLPFTVRALSRFSVPGGGHAFVATLVRQINQEATPLQERTFLVAERDTSADSAFSAAYSDRSYGNEESIETRQVLAVIQLGSARRPTIIFSRDFGDSMSFGFIERADNGRWRPRWMSQRRHC
jgi:hypothetical protein